MNSNLYNSRGSKLFDGFNYVFLTLLAASCLLPMIHVISLSLSDAASAGANLVTFWPKGFNTASYELVFRNQVFIRSFMISVSKSPIFSAVKLSA